MRCSTCFQGSFQIALSYRVAEVMLYIAILSDYPYLIGFISDRQVVLYSPSQRRPEGHRPRAVQGVDEGAGRLPPGAEAGRASGSPVARCGRT